MPDGGAEDPAAPEGDAATDRIAPAEVQDRANVDAVPGSVTSQKEVAGMNINALDSVSIAASSQTSPVRALVTAAARPAISICRPDLLVRSVC